MFVKENVLLLGAIFIASFFFTALYRNIAIKKSILDVPNDRSSHEIPTPRGGGIAIVLAFYLGLTFIYLKGNVDKNLFLALLSGLLLVVTGLFDDILNLPALFRFLIQAFTVSMALFFLGGLLVIDLGISPIESKLILNILAIIGMVWFINLYNFIDGIDGYASMQAIFVAGALFLLTKSAGVLILAVATLGFLPWNWQKAKIFMGDVGSTILGFVLAVFAIYFQNINEVSLVHWLILTSLFWFDATFTLFRRWRNKESLSQAHRKHAYQRLVQSGFSHQKVTLIGLAINLILLLIVIIFQSGYKIIIGFSLCLLIQFGYTLFVDKRKPFPKDT